VKEAEETCRKDGEKSGVSICSVYGGEGNGGKWREMEGGCGGNIEEAVGGS